MVRLKIDRNKCIGCGSCVSLYPEVFEMNGSKAKERNGEKEFSNEEGEEIKLVCPVEAIIENNDK